MDFIISLAHFCEDHGPTSILCTQVIPPTCPTCYPNSSGTREIARTPSNGSSTATPPGSSHGHRMRDGRSGENTPAASPRGLSPSATPPSSPRTNFSTLPTSASTGTISDTGCKNCSITIPPRINSSSRDGKPRFRTTESYPVSAPTDPDSPVDPTSSHTHTISYISCRAPSLPSRFSTVRQFCIRALNHEFSHQKISPVMFGDIITGWCIYVTFKLPDPKSRGSLRTYAVLCISKNQRALVHSWNLITHTFLGFIHKIQHEVAAKNASPQSSSSSTNPANQPILFRPEGFLRRHPGMEGNTQRSLADLTGQEDFFLGVHTTFVQLLSSLTKIHGFATSGHDSPIPLPGGTPPPIVTGTDGRSRAASIGRSPEPEEQRWRAAGGGGRAQSPRGLEKEMRAREMRSPEPEVRGGMLAAPKLERADTSTSTVTIKPATPVSKSSSPNSGPQAPSPPKSTDELTNRRQVAVG